jgi:hypothetical protein
MKLVAVNFAVVILLASVKAAGAPAAAEAPNYVAPTGFGTKHWGDPLNGFEQFVDAEPFSMSGSWTRGKTTERDFNCIMTTPVLPSATEAQAAGSSMLALPTEACDLGSSSMRNKVEGRGFHVLVEHRNESQGFRFGGKDGVLLYPVIFQFCAKWDSLKVEEPPNFKELVKFCGMRLMFRGETDEELAALPAGEQTRFDQVLDFLIAQYGRPERFQKRGRVEIEAEGGAAVVGERRYRTSRWCPPRDRDIATKCDASVVLAYDGVKRWGYVLYSSPAVWEYAFARESSGFKGEYLYRMLHAQGPASSAELQQTTVRDEK